MQCPLCESDHTAREAAFSAAASGSLMMPFREQVLNGASYFLVYPSQRAAQPKIRVLADILVRLART
jgi:hypothetical protein